MALHRRNSRCLLYRRKQYHNIGPGLGSGLGALAPAPGPRAWAGRGPRDAAPEASASSASAWASPSASWADLGAVVGLRAGQTNLAPSVGSGLSVAELASIGSIGLTPTLPGTRAFGQGPGPWALGPGPGARGMRGRGEGGIHGESLRIFYWTPSFPWDSRITSPHGGGWGSRNFPNHIQIHLVTMVCMARPPPGPPGKPAYPVWGTESGRTQSGYGDCVGLLRTPPPYTAAQGLILSRVQ